MKEIKNKNSKQFTKNKNAKTYETLRDFYQIEKRRDCLY